MGEARRTVPRAVIDAICIGLEVISKPLRSTSNSACSTTARGSASSMCALKVTGRTCPAASNVPSQWSSDGPAGRAEVTVRTEDVGAYKPAENHFRALATTLAELGLKRAALLHVAQSLFHDHVPAQREGLRSVWINRRHGRPGWGATPEPSEKWSYDLQFRSMGDFAYAVDRAFAGSSSTT